MSTTPHPMNCATCGDTGIVLTHPNSDEFCHGRAMGTLGPLIAYVLCDCIRSLLPTFAACVECGIMTDERVNPCVKCRANNVCGPLDIRRAQAAYEATELLTVPDEVATPQPVAAIPAVSSKEEVPDLPALTTPNASYVSRWPRRDAPGVTYAPETPENAPDLSALERRWDDCDVVWRVVETDNLGRDYPNEQFHGPCLTKGAAEEVATIFNKTAETTQRFYKVRPYTYKLEPGFEP
jgi:hypothetical protein